MCGIAGIISPNPALVNAQQLKQMTDAIAHRGPEGDAFWFNESNTAGLGHRRLSIIDLSTAASQPMHYRHCSIVYNGEIYNYIELKDELMKMGFSFNTHSDTEVILAAYVAWGTKCLDKFDGMFAFAIWDAKANALFAARDRFGEKPFYYKRDKENNALWFASEMKAFYAAGFKRQMNEKMLLLFLTNGFTDTAADASVTFDTHISQLPPSHFMMYELRGDKSVLKIERYWDIDTETGPAIPGIELVDVFSDALRSSVAMRFRSDVPVGTSLSGGLDSSSIAALASNTKTGSNSYKCFSAVFPGFEKDESQYSSLVAKWCGLEQFVTTPSANDLVQDMQQFLYMQEEPVGSASVYAQYKVYELAKQHGVTVLLDGQGADEVLAGYPKYFNWYLQELIKENPGSLRAELAAIRKNTQVEWGWKNHLASYLPAQAAKQLKKRVLDKIKTDENIDRDFRAANTDTSLVLKPAVRNLNDILYFNISKAGLPELLRYADRNSMAHGRELRLPFLYHELVQICFMMMPTAFKIRDGFTKWVLRKSMERYLPTQIVWRTDKIGFEPPQKEWMQNQQVQEMIMASKEKLVSQRILNASVLNKKIQPQESHAADNVDWWSLSAGLLPG